LEVWQINSSVCVCVPKNEFQAAEEPPTHLGRCNLELSFIFVPDAMMNLIPALSLYIPKLPALGVCSIGFAGA
jgi:hypothetical protein